MSQRLFSIPSAVPFVDALADGLMARAGDDPAVLADSLILLPTRRACRALREAFLRRSDGRAMLLPAMRPIGDVDEEELVLIGPTGPDGARMELFDLPPAISDTERLFHLTGLVRAYRARLAESRPGLDPISPEQALLLARELARLLDQSQTEGLSLDRLDKLVPEKYSDYWALTLTFLDILRTAWPDHLSEAGLMDPAARRDRLLTAQAEAWEARPPDRSIIAAGSTGSIPAAARLIATVARLPRGQVVLPGLDRDLAEEDWPVVRDDPTHPQHGLALLLDKLGAQRADVAEWEASMPSIRAARIHLLTEAMRPADTTHRWGALDGADAGSIDPDAFTGVEWLEAPTPAAEAALAAQCLREALETPNRTAALVTPDRILARRVAAQMTRWGIEIDDSAGVPLAQTAAGRFLMLVAEAAAAGLAPVALLAALKQPLAALGQAPRDLRRAIRRLENPFLRGVKPARGAEGLRAAIHASEGGRQDPGQDRRDDAEATVSLIEAALSPLLAMMDGGDAPFDVLLRAHLAAAEAVAASRDESGADRLWRGEDGEALAEFAAEIAAHAPLLGRLRPSDYAPVMTALMAGRTVRPRFGTHPRLAILGPLEARLQHADLLVLAGLNEGTWPPESPEDPWMSRAMRADFGLPAHERRIGLAAHDFAQAFGAPEVVLLRAAKSGGQPTVPARWLERLATVLKRAGMEHLTPEMNGATAPRLAWRSALESATEVARVGRPAPRPPLAARPRRLSATRIETLMRDPYSIYARFVLDLEPLDPLEADLGAADKGTMIHEALDRFVRDNPDTLPDDAVDILVDLGRAAFGKDALARPGIQAFWWPRFRRIARWFVEVEEERRSSLDASHTEIRGKHTFEAPGGPFTLSAEADRIDRQEDGAFVILDYKTGAVPSKKDVATLAAPQLVLEAAILRNGGFPGIAPGPIDRFEYWKLSGGEPAGEITRIDGVEPDALADAVLEKLKALIAAYDDPATAYPSVPRADQAPRFNDYAHLARIKEWMLGDGPGGDGA